MDLNTILIMQGYVVAFIFLITIYFWVVCKNSGVIDLFKKPVSAGLVLGLGVPLLLGSIHYFSQEVHLLLKYGSFCLFSFVLLCFSYLNFVSSKRETIQESREYMNLRKRSLEKPLPPDKERVKRQLMKYFIEPELDKLKQLEKENKKELKGRLGGIKDKEEEMQDKLEDFAEKEKEIEERLEKLNEGEEKLRLSKDEIKFNLNEIKRELNNVEISKDGILKEKDGLELKNLKLEKDRERIKKKLQDLLMFEEELEKEKQEFKKARREADRVINVKKKVDDKIKEYNSKLKVFVQEKKKVEIGKRTTEARSGRLDDEWDDIKDDKAWIEKQKYNIKKGYEKLGDKKKKLQLYEDKLMDQRDDLEIEKGQSENLKTSLRKMEDAVEKLRSENSTKDEAIKALKEKFRRSR